MRLRSRHALVLFIAAVGFFPVVMAGLHYGGSSKVGGAAVVAWFLAIQGALFFWVRCPSCRRLAYMGSAERPGQSPGSHCRACRAKY